MIAFAAEDSFTIFSIADVVFVFILVIESCNDSLAANGASLGGGTGCCYAGSVIEFADCVGGSRNFMTARRAFNNKVVAAFCLAGSGNFVFNNCICRGVIEFINGFGFSRKLFAALGAVNDTFVTTCGGAGSTNFIFSYRLSTGVLAGRSFCFA